MDWMARAARRRFPIFHCYLYKKMASRDKDFFYKDPPPLHESQINSLCEFANVF